MVLIEVGSPKTAREMFASAQHTLMKKVEQGGYSGTPHSAYDILMMQSIINQLDVHRPLGVDGKHGDLHTETCGCEDA